MDQEEQKKIREYRDQISIDRITWRNDKDKNYDGTNIGQENESSDINYGETRVTAAERIIQIFNNEQWKQRLKQNIEADEARKKNHQIKNRKQQKIRSLAQKSKDRKAYEEAKELIKKEEKGNIPNVWSLCKNLRNKKQNK